jgi:hypothetical protein
VLDRIKVRPILEYVVGERLKMTNTTHSEVTFAFSGPSLRKTELSHLQIGNTELEYLAGGPGA